MHMHAWHLGSQKAKNYFHCVYYINIMNKNPTTKNLSEITENNNNINSELQKKLLQFLLVSCQIAPSTGSADSSVKTSMMPLAPTMTELPAAHKPKIGFSIDSIVGGRKEEDSSPKTHNHNNHHDRSRRTSSSVETHHTNNSESRSRSPTQTPPEERSSPDTPENRGMAAGGMSPGALAHHLPKHHPHHHHPFLHHHLLNNEKNGSLSPPMPSVHPSSHHPHHMLHPLHHQLRLPFLQQQQLPQHHHQGSPPVQNHSPLGRLSPSSTSNNKNNNNDNNTNNSISKDENQVTSSRSPSPQSSRGGSPKTSLSDVPSQSPEIHPPIAPQGALGMPGMRPGFPPHMGGGPPGMPPHFASYPPGMLNFAMAAAAAAQGQGHPGLPGWMPGHHPGAPHHPHPAAAAHPLYPWLLAKQSRLFPHRFGPGPGDLPGFLFQPFRKPKRIRTAFSPSQLLKLEHAFEKNHYVVGAERKQLAKALSLSETQVKVWFQNRRTKHKRVETEDEIMKKPDGSSRGHNNSSSSDLPSSGSNHSAISADSSTRNYSEEMSDEEIDMHDEYSDEEEMEHGHHHGMHHLSNSYS